MSLTFEWDESKAQKNFQKHKVDFDEAKTVFYDPFLLTYSDTFHSDTESRFVNIGISIKMRTLLVIHTERNETIRIISCRNVTKSEQKNYEARR